MAALTPRQSSRNRTPSLKVRQNLSQQSSALLQNSQVSPSPNIVRRGKKRKVPKSKTSKKQKKKTIRKKKKQKSKPSPVKSDSFITKLVSSPTWPEGTPDTTKHKWWNSKHDVKINKVSISSPLDAVKVLLDGVWKILFKEIKQQLEKEETLTLKAKHFTEKTWNQYLAVLLLLGVRKSTKAKNCWNKKSADYTPHIAAIIGRDRWTKINVVFTKVCKTENAFYKVWSEMKQICREVYLPTEIVNIDELKKVGKTRPVPLLKQVYDEKIAYEDNMDQTGAKTQPKIRSKPWERTAIDGVMNSLIVSNSFILFSNQHAKDAEKMTTADFVERVAFELADYTPFPSHSPIERTRGNCAVCMWWKKNKAKGDYKINKSFEGCKRCRVRVCKKCWGNRHNSYVVALNK